MKHTPPSDDEAVVADCLRRIDVLAPDITAMARRIDAERDIPAELADRLDGAGLLRLLLPRSLGGAALALPSMALVVEALAKLDASVAWCVAQTCGCSTIAAYMDPDAAGRVFHTQPRGVVAWGPGPGARAVAAPNGYRVTGSFSFASGSHLATWLGAACDVHETDGRPRLDADGRPMTRLLLIPRDAAPLQDRWHVIGLKGTASDSYEVTDLFVPNELAIAKDDPLARRDAATLYCFHTAPIYAICFASVALGIARAMMDSFISLAVVKTPRGQASSLARNPLTQYEIGVLEARLRAARLLLLSSIEDVWSQVRDNGSLTLDQRVTIRLAATHGIAEAVAVADGIYRAAGATAIFEDAPFERRFRDIHSVAQQIQGRNAHFETVGCYLMGGSPSTAFL